LRCEIINRKGQAEVVCQDQEAVVNSEALLIADSRSPIGSVPGKGAKG